MVRNVTLLIGSRISLFALGFQYINVKGKKATRREAPIIIANHVSFMEAGYFFGFHSSIGLIKAEAGEMPVIGTIMKALQTIFVAREDKNSKEYVKKALIEKARSPLPWNQISIFPEGTCTNQKALIQFKQGAFLPGTPIQPMYFDLRRNKNFPPHFLLGGPDLGKIILRCMTQFHNYFDVIYLPVYVPNEEEKKDPFLYAENVRQYMAKELNLPCTNHSLEDMFLLDVALKKHIPDSALNTDYNSIKTVMHNFDLAKAKALQK